MRRRGFLRLLGAAPVAAPIAAKEVVSGMSVQNRAMGAVGNQISARTTGPNNDPVFEKLSSAVSRHNFENETSYIGEVPQIAAMKSWSAVFKHSETRKDYIKKEKHRRAIMDVLYGDLSTAEKIVRIAAMGVKV